MTPDLLEQIKEQVLKVWGNEIAGVNNREEIRKLKNLILEAEKEKVGNGVQS